MEYLDLEAGSPKPTPVNVKSDSSLLRYKAGIATFSDVDKCVLYSIISSPSS
ncbi:hypothetical protein [Clostridium perfringens]|uniref:hypothetical protein n=1 Tax=Clostridium perfringens TaxID=1502 RepID=UPI001FABFAF6|nr:hypothetical protein [Clostridium perfringens]